jgi:RNA polymerase sigma-70 factor (ECF subfamily)
MEKMINVEERRFLFFEKSNTEEQLVQRAKAGDRNAFAQIYDLYADSVYRFVFSRVSSEAAAEDLTSQVFLKAWESIARFHERGVPFRAWLFRIARNSVIDHYRTSKPHVCIDLIPNESADPDGDVAAKVETKWEEEKLAEAMTQLTEDQQQVLALKFLAGLSTEEAALVMGKRAGAIRALQMRGLQALAKILEIEVKDGKFSENS